jgi:hypothetical protein
MLFIGDWWMTNSTAAIVLTGTIVPNIQNHHRHLDIETRRSEYLQAIRFYSSIAPVYFLENSSYRLLEDDEFQRIPNTQLCKFPVSEFSAQGRGFQEFEMLDRWIATTPNLPHGWLKITGRYLYENIAQIWQECVRSTNADILVNQYRFAGYANPAIFYIHSDYYRQQIADIYQRCDDAAGRYIEKVLFEQLRTASSGQCQRFQSPLLCSGIAGASGQEMRQPTKDRVNALLAAANYSFDKKYIWLSF